MWYLSASVAQGKLPTDEGLNVLRPATNKVRNKYFKAGKKVYYPWYRGAQSTCGISDYSRIEHDFAQQHIFEGLDGSGAVDGVIALKGLVEVGIRRLPVFLLCCMNDSCKDKHPSAGQHHLQILSCGATNSYLTAYLKQPAALGDNI